MLKIFRAEIAPYTSNKRSIHILIYETGTVRETTFPITRGAYIHPLRRLCAEEIKTTKVAGGNTGSPRIGQQTHNILWQQDI